MTKFSIGTMKPNSAWAVFRMRDRIKMDPVYQRQSGVWNREKRQLLIDTMINGFDVPKLYLHKFQAPEEDNGASYEFALIDGKQRVQTIFDFIENRFTLDDDFKYMLDQRINLSGLTYRELAQDFPEIKADFDSYTLDMITIETDEIELIEDLFSRLNEAVPLNAPEKRNAKPGPLPSFVRTLSSHRFFVEKLPFTNSRYRHFDLIAKMLLFVSRASVADTKKAYLDRFFAQHAESTSADVQHFLDKTTLILDAMTATFTDNDPLLKSVGMVSLYFLLFERAVDSARTTILSRAEFAKFDDMRAQNRIDAEKEISAANYELLEFDRFTQSPNDGNALRYRLAVIDKQIFNSSLGFASEGVLD